MHWLKILGIWFAISVVVCPFIGKFLKGLTLESPPNG